MTIEGNEPDDVGDPVARVVVLALDWSTEGGLPLESFHQIVTDVELPASLYRAAVQAVESAGVKLVEADEDVIDEEVPGGDSGWNVDGFSEFLRHNHHRILTQEEEVNLAGRIERGRVAQRALDEIPDLPPEAITRIRSEVRDGRRAASDLAAHNLRLVAKIANKYRHLCTPALEVEDLFQHGCLGLERAIDKFDPTKGFKFSTYATWWIRQNIDRALADSARTIRLPVHARDALRKILRAEREILDAGDRATVEAIAARADETPAKVRELLQWRYHADSLDRVVGNSESTLGDFIRDAGASEPETLAELEVLGDDIDEALASLNPREAAVLRLRFGLDDGKQWTLEEIGARPEFNVTRERIRQIEAKALKKLRGSFATRSLREYLTDEE